MRALTRRAFLGRAIAVLAVAAPAAAAAPRVAHAGAPRGTPHPTPRPGITGERVLGAAQLAEEPRLVPLFDAVRAAPQVIDGIRCQCGCADLPGNYSLLSCFEGEAMARHCGICQGQARLATRLHREGKSLDEIRAAIDAKFG